MAKLQHPWTSHGCKCLNLVLTKETSCPLALNSMAYLRCFAKLRLQRMLEMVGVQGQASVQVLAMMTA